MPNGLGRVPPSAIGAGTGRLIGLMRVPPTYVLPSIRALPDFQSVPSVSTFPPYAAPEVAPAPTLPLNIPVTAGEITAPAAGTILAITAALERGNWELWILAGVRVTAGVPGNDSLLNFRIDRISQSGTGSAMWTQQFGQQQTPWRMRAHAEALDVFRIINIQAGAAAAIYSASIWIAGPF